MLRSRTAFLLCVCLLALPSVAAAALLVIDDLSQPLPPNPCLPETNAPIVFNGSWCDAAYCPPGMIVSSCSGSEVAGQVGLPGTLQNTSNTVSRLAKVDQNSTSGYTASGVIGSFLWKVSGEDPLGTTSYLRYGAAGWNLDFHSMGVLGIEFLLEGDVSAAHPLYCSIQLLDRDVNLRYGTTTIVATAPGLLTFPISTFTTYNGFDFTGIDDINFSFTDCAFGYCNSPVTARRYAVGPPALGVSGGTAAKPMTWGRVKQIYR